MLRVKQVGGRYYIHGTVIRPDGTRERVRRSLGLGKGEEEYLEAAKARVLRSVMEPKAEGTVSDVARAYLGRPDAPGSSTVWIIQDFEKALGSVLVSDLVASAVEAHAYGDGGTKPGTVARKLTAIKAMLRWGKRRGFPVSAELLEAIEKPRVDDAREVCLTKAEEARLFSEMCEDLRDLCVFLVNTGLRLGEARRLTLADYDEVDGSITTWTKKGAGRKLRKRRVPLNAAATDALLRQVRKGKGLSGSISPIFTDRKGQPWCRTTLYTRWHEACEAAGFEDLRPHDLRHTFASRLVQGGVELHVVGRLLGHSSLQTTVRYSHLAPTQLKDVVERL